MADLQNVGIALLAAPLVWQAARFVVKGERAVVFPWFFLFTLVGALVLATGEYTEGSRLGTAAALATGAASAAALAAPVVASFRARASSKGKAAEDSAAQTPRSPFEEYAQEG